MKKTLKLLKLTLTAGVLLGIILKLRDSIRIKAFACGFQSIETCGITPFLKELLVWVLMGTGIALVVVFGSKFIIKDLIKGIKKIKLPKKKAKKEEKVKKVIKKETKKETPKKEEGVIKI